MVHFISSRTLSEETGAPDIGGAVMIDLRAPGAVEAMLDAFPAKPPRQQIRASSSR